MQVTGQVDKSVFERGLVSELPKWKDIVENHGSYYHNTAQRAVQHMSLAYVTPVSYHNNCNVLSQSSLGFEITYIHNQAFV